MAAEFHSMRHLPASGKPGDLYMETQTRTLHLVLGDGRLYSMADLFRNGVPSNGPPGATVRVSFAVLQELLAEVRRMESGIAKALLMPPGEERIAAIHPAMRPVFRGDQEIVITINGEPL